jgi:phage terminase large subunit GpA-like protein
VSDGKIIAAFASTWRPQDKRTVAEWASEHIKIPNSARSSSFDPTASPWLAEPLEFFADPTVKEQVLILPTGAGKTTVFDVAIPYIISEAPGGILLSMQTDPDAKEHMEDRLLPILRACDPIAPLLDGVDRHAKRKDAIILPHMSLFVGGANKANFQRKSVRYVFLDEAWLIKHGLIEEARARTHSRWNSRVIIVSQGGEQHINLQNERRDSELYAAWMRSDRREFSLVCPTCSEPSRWDFRNLKYECEKSDDGSIDELAIAQSATYECPLCNTRYSDKPEVRRELATASRYVATHPGGLPGHHGWHAPAVALFHERWGDLALGWTRAQRALSMGDQEPLKIFVTKRLAEFWREEETAPEVALGGAGYSKGEYANGEPWDDEEFDSRLSPVVRAITIDRQRDHRWVVARAWRRDGSSRLLWEGRMQTSEDIESLRRTLNVRPQYTFQDAQYETGQVYDECVRWGWVALHGGKEDGFMHFPRNKPSVKKFYSEIKRASAPGGGVAYYLFWSNEKVKDVLANLRGGKGAKWETPDDVSGDYVHQIASEVKRDVVNKATKGVSSRWVRVRKDNHLWDCEAMQTVFAIFNGFLGAS